VQGEVTESGPERGGWNRSAEEPGAYEVWWTLRKRIKPLAAFVLGLTLITWAGSAFVLPKTYRAEATILPLEPPDTTLITMLAQFGGTLPLLGLQKQTSSQTIIAILESRTIAEAIARRFESAKIFERKEKTPEEIGHPLDPPEMESRIKRIKSMRKVIWDKKTGVVKIRVEHGDPELAAQVANAYLEEADKFMRDNALTMVKRQRIFLETQVEKTKKELQRAEEELKAFQEEKRLVVMDAQAQAAIKGVAELKAIITAKEVELDVLKTYATPQNPRVQILDSEIKELTKQLQKLEAENSAKGGSDLSLVSAPDLGLTYARLQREVSYREKLLEMLYKMYESARIDEAREDIKFQIIDQAVPSYHPVSPRPLLNAVIAFFLSLALAILCVSSLEKGKRSKKGGVRQSEPPLAPMGDTR
jgi:capsule polysaccharide export protein KpsE/RkpR